MKTIRKGFTLVELMIVVALIGILAAIALPVYQDYTIRGKVADLVVAMTSYKASISEKAFNDTTLASAGIGLTVIAGGKISGGSITDSGLITVAGSSTSVGTAVSVVLVPSLSAGRIVWACSTNGDTSQWKYVPAECRN